MSMATIGVNAKGPTYLVLAIHSIATAADSGEASASCARATHGAVVAPASAPLPVRAITSHMAGVTTDTADDVGREVLLLRTVVLAMTDLAAVLACLVLVVTQGTVQGSKLTQLVTLELVLAFRNRCSLMI